MVITTKSIIDQFLERFEHWMSHAEFGHVGELPHAPFKTTHE